MARGSSRKIVLATFGSFGDLHPYIAIALELKRRGHHPVIATSAYYREKVEAEGVGFHALRPDLPPIEDAPDVLRKTLDKRSGGQYLFKELIMPGLRDSYADLRAATKDASLLLSHPLIFGAPALAEKTGIAWLSSVLAPTSMFSAFDPPVPYMAPSLHNLLVHPLVARIALAVGKRGVEGWVEPVRRLRAELGLAPGAHPMFEGQHSPAGVLALFSSVLAKPQPDYPPRTHITGFPFYDRLDRAGKAAMSDDLSKFLEAGEPPIVFTLGSSAVWIADEFYRESLLAAAREGRRAVLLIGDSRNMPKDKLPPGIAAFDYAAYSELFPRASVVVHSGGIGSTGQALRAGVSTLIVPFSYDQPDNAARVARTGCGRTLTRARYKAARVADELRELLANESYRRRAKQVAAIVNREHGAATACDHIEAEMNRHESLTPPMAQEQLA